MKSNNPTKKGNPKLMKVRSNFKKELFMKYKKFSPRR